MAMKGGVRTILALDGGGIRGLIPALILQELQRKLEARGKSEPLHRYFDLIAGTSTGGIIAAGLAAPDPRAPETPAMTPERLVELYRSDGARIFARDRFRNLREAFRELNTEAIFQEKYSADTLEELLDRHLGESRLRKALTNVVITAYDIEARDTVFLRGGPDINALNDKNGVKHDFYFQAAARATSAAPTYFEPEQVSNIASGEVHALIDGGVFANQPSLCAFAQARALGWTPDKIEVLSLGTGYQTRRFPIGDVKDWGPGQWINPMKGAPIISILMHGQADSTNWQMAQILGQRFTRLDAKLIRGKGNDDMDDASPGNLLALADLARDIIDGHDRQLEDWAERLEPS